ncbi:MAG: hypothetical protein ACX939_05050, partial [Hyphococcus sp.]
MESAPRSGEMQAPFAASSLHEGPSLMAFLGIAKKIFGSSNDRRLKPLWRRVEAINALEDEIAKLTDDGL